MPTKINYPTKPDTDCFEHLHSYLRFPRTELREITCSHESLDTFPTADARVPENAATEIKILPRREQSGRRFARVRLKKQRYAAPGGKHRVGITYGVAVQRGPPIPAKQWFVRIDAWAEWRTSDDNETLRRAGHCNRSAMRLLGSSVPYARLVSLPPGACSRNPETERGTRRARGTVAGAR